MKRKLAILNIIGGFGVVGILLYQPLQGQFANAQPHVIWPDIAIVLVEGGFTKPIGITNAGDGSNRLFVVEQDGVIKIIQNNQFSGTFLDIKARVRSAIDEGGGSEEGLLGLAFPPGYGSGNDYFYVYYTNLSGNNQVSRFHLGASDDQADPNSEELILQFNHPTNNNHNGGQIAFGADGYLYIGTGDGGGGGDPLNNAQNSNSLLGKLLRIDTEMGPLQPDWGNHQTFLPLMVQDTGSPAAAYRIPPDNPFVGMPGYRPEIWAIGMRNPWRFSFDRTTQDLYIGDVGQELLEEIDFQSSTSTGGENYGWRIMEGNVCYNNLPCNPAGLTLPIHTYPHTEGCSVTGGYVYRGSAYPGMTGIYFFGDYCSGNIWGLQRENNAWTAQFLLNVAFGLSSFGESESGELYLADLNNGTISQIQESAPAP